jgi:hypothetical protein
MKKMKKMKMRKMRKMRKSMEKTVCYVLIHFLAHVSNTELAGADAKKIQHATTACSVPCIILVPNVLSVSIKLLIYPIIRLKK